MMIRLSGGHYPLKGSRYCVVCPLCAENEIVWCVRFTFVPLWPLDGRWGSWVPRVIYWHRQGASNLHTETLCISKEPQRRPPVSDRYLRPARGRLGRLEKLLVVLHPIIPSPLPNHIYIFIFILEFPPVLDLVRHSPSTGSYLLSPSLRPIYHLPILFIYLKIVD